MMDPLTPPPSLPLQVLSDVYPMHIRVEVVIAAVLPLVAVCSWIRNLDELVPLSTMANLCILFSLSVILYDELDEFATSRAAVLHKGGVELAAFPGLPLFFGNLAFAFDAIPLILPLENKMQRPQHAMRVIVVAMATVILLYSVFGVLGYLAFGQDTAASITLNLHSEGTMEKM